MGLYSCRVAWLLAGQVRVVVTTENEMSSQIWNESAVEIPEGWIISGGKRRKQIEIVTDVRSRAVGGFEVRRASRLSRSTSVLTKR